MNQWYSFSYKYLEKMLDMSMNGYWIFNLYVKLYNFRNQYIYQCISMDKAMVTERENCFFTKKLYVGFCSFWMEMKLWAYPNELFCFWDVRQYEISPLDPMGCQLFHSELLDLLEFVKELIEDDCLL